MTGELDAAAEYENLLEFLYVCPVGIAQLTASGDVEMMNPALARMLMEVSAQPSVENLFTALGPAGAELSTLAAGLTAAQGTICEAHRITFDAPKRIRPLTMSCTLLKLSGARIMAVVADESRLEEQERVARRAEQKAHAMMDGIRDYSIIALDRDGLIESWNRSAERLFGYSAEEMIGQDYAFLFPRDHDSASRHAQVMSDAVQGGWGEDEGWWARKETTRFWGSTVVSVIEEEDGGRGGYTVVTRDLTRKKREEDDLRNAASHDFLTGILNRRGFEESAREELGRWQRGRDPLSLLVIDADHFKHVNDTHGHGVGDDVLRTIARVMQDQVRELDLVGRLGGEEFVILLPSTDAIGGRACAERIRQAIEATRVTTPEGATVRITVSIGVAQASRALGTIELLMQCADAALYEAKHGGRNRSRIGHGADALSELALPAE